VLLQVAAMHSAYRWPAADVELDAGHLADHATDLTPRWKMSWQSHHWATSNASCHWTAISGDRWPDDMRRLIWSRDLPARLAAGVARMCGRIGRV
jgi:hypothetical protein